jgi:hypothetical protein
MDKVQKYNSFNNVCCFYGGSKVINSDDNDLTLNRLEN